MLVMSNVIGVKASELTTSCESHSTMVDGNKFKIVDGHCKRIDNQLQTYHLE